MLCAPVVRVACAAALSLSALSLASCAPKPQQAPPGVSEPIESTAEGLLTLFRRECIEQQNLQWARDESDRRAYYHCRALPGSLLTKEGKIGDCESEVGGHVEWIVSTAQQEPIEIYLAWYDWNWPRDQHVACGIKVPESLGSALQQAANLVAEEDFAAATPAIRYSYGYDEYWQWSLTPPRLLLEHLDSQGNWSLRLQVHPDFPENYNFVRDHVMRECPLNHATDVYECTYQRDPQQQE